MEVRVANTVGIAGTAALAVLVAALVAGIEPFVRETAVVSARALS